MSCLYEPSSLEVLEDLRDSLEVFNLKADRLHLGMQEEDSRWTRTRTRALSEEVVVVPLDPLLRSVRPISLPHLDPILTRAE